MAIISVAISGVVGIGGLAAAAWGTARERRWRTREERATDLRGALESAAESLLDLAWDIDVVRLKIKRGEGMSSEEKTAVESHARQASVTGRAHIAVRQGANAAEATSLEAWIGKVSTLIGILGEGTNSGWNDQLESRWKDVWAKAVEAEKAYFTATVKALT